MSVVANRFYVLKLDDLKGGETHDDRRNAHLDEPS